MRPRGRSKAAGESCSLVDFGETAIRLAQNSQEANALYDDVHMAKSELCALMRDLTTIRAQALRAKAQREDEEEKLRRATAAAGRRDVGASASVDAADARRRARAEPFDVVAYIDVLRRHAELSRRCA